MSLAIGIPRAAPKHWCNDDKQHHLKHAMVEVEIQLAEEIIGPTFVAGLEGGGTHPSTLSKCCMIFRFSALFLLKQQGFLTAVSYQKPCKHQNCQCHLKHLWSWPMETEVLNP